MIINKEKLFYFDIETIGKYPDYETFKRTDERGAKLFETKFNKKHGRNEFGWETLEESYLKNSTLYPEYGEIVCVTMAYYVNNELRLATIKNENNEFELLKKIQQYFNKIDTLGLTLCGYNIKGFDIPWLFKKLCMYNLEVPNNLNDAGKKPWEINIIDLMELWKGTAFETTTFDELAYTLNIPSPKEEPVSGPTLHNYYWTTKNIDEIAFYCERDVETLVEIVKILSQLI